MILGDIADEFYPVVRNSIRASVDFYDSFVCKEKEKGRNSIDLGHGIGNSCSGLSVDDVSDVTGDLTLCNIHSVNGEII